MRPVVLDLDGSVGSLPSELRIGLRDWQEALRFGCKLADLAALGRTLQGRIPSPSSHGTVLLGSGDFHHLSHLLIERRLKSRESRQPMMVVVFDNHPDNMRFPFGIHCGSWVGRVARLAGVSHVHVIGITSKDIGWFHAWENQLAPLRAGKLSYWSVGVRTGWSRLLGLQRAFCSFASFDALVEAAHARLATEAGPVYVSIDKDVFSSDVVHTNWDQGRMKLSEIDRLMSPLRGRIVGSDITGDLSAYSYATPWKRWLSRLDGQQELPWQEVARGHPAQTGLTERLLKVLDGCEASGP